MQLTALQISISFAGRAASLCGCVARPKVQEIGLADFAAQIQCSLSTGSCAMETIEHREPYELRGSRTVLGGLRVKLPSGYSTAAAMLK